MNVKKKFKLSLWFALFATILRAQVSVVNIQLMPYNVTPDGLLAASIMNNGSPQQVQLISKLYNFNNELQKPMKLTTLNRSKLTT